MTRSDTAINLIYNESIQITNDPLIDLQEALNNDTYWRKLPYISSNMQAILNFLNNTPKPITSEESTIWSSHPLSTVKLIFITILFVVVLCLIVYVIRLKRAVQSTTNVTVSMPSMKQLLAQDT